MVSVRLFSFIFSSAYCVSCCSCSCVSMFLARLRSSMHMSLNTRSAHLSLASSISSLQAVYIVSFMVFLAPVVVSS